MKIFTRSILMAGVATVTATVVVFAQSVQPAPPPTPPPTLKLIAAVQPLALQQQPLAQQQPLVAAVQPTQLPPQPPLLTILLNSPLALLGPAAPLGTLPPAPAPLAIPIAPNLADTIDGIYIAVEPWVQYGFEVATSIVRWIPYVGWFAGLIMDGYFFGESLVASGVFNFTDWLRGDGGVGENLVDFGIDVGLAFVWLGLDALNSFIPLPPFCCYPPRPPVQGPFLALETLLDPTETAALTEPIESMAMMGADVPGAATLVEETVEETEDPGSTETLGDVVEGEEAVVETDLVDAAVTEEEATLEIETEGTEEESTLDGQEDATLEEELAVEDEAAEEEESTTSSSGTVQAQGEVVDTGINASPDETADNTADISSNDDTPDDTTGPTDAAPANDDAGEE